MRPLYRFLLRLHPPAFGERFGGEMMSIFDHSGHKWRLIGDAAESLVRQWLLRPEFHTAPAMPRSARLESWLLGFAMTSVSFLGLAVLLNDGVDGLNTTIRAGESAILDSLPGRAMATQLFRDVRVLGALDTNHDRVLSSYELSQAPQRLLELDRDRDGILSTRECTRGHYKLRIGRFGEIGASDPATVMRRNPALVALDLDRDGVISAEEMRQAESSLRRLDANGDGELTPEELFTPDRFQSLEEMWL